MWNEIWQFIYSNYIFHTAVIVAVAYLVFFPKRLNRALGKFKKLKAGPFELQAGDEIDPNADCPYTRSRDITFKALRDIESKVNKLEEKVDSFSGEMRKAVDILMNMSIDEQKSHFYDQNQPDAERLMAGLKYIYQGGNGLTKPDVVKFAEANKEMYNLLTKAKPELRIRQ